MIPRGEPVELDPGYCAEVATLDAQGWAAITRQFSDANIYQTFEFDASPQGGGGQLQHLLLHRDGRLVAAAQARLVRLPIVGRLVAYMRWAPLWHLAGESEDVAVLGQALRAVRNEFVVKRRLPVRLLPRLFADQRELYLPLLSREGFVLQRFAHRSRTLIVDLSRSLEELRKGLDGRWRNCLNKAERSNLELIEGVEDELFEAFTQIHTEMQSRKGFYSETDLTKFRAAQRALAPEAKMKIILCRSAGEPCAGGISSAIGDTSLYLFGATATRGLQSCGSYLIQWKMLQWAKERGCRWYDLHGINPAKNPGTYRFKARLAGKNGIERLFLGQFDAYESSLSCLLLSLGDLLRAGWRALAEARHRTPEAKEKE
jgi:hypothetical protein